MSWDAIKEKTKFSIYVHPDCHTTCQDRLLKVREASCGAKRGRQTLALFSSRVNRNEQQQDKYFGRGTVLDGTALCCTALEGRDLAVRGFMLYTAATLTIPT